MITVKLTSDAKTVDFEHEFEGSTPTPDMYEDMIAAMKDNWKTVIGIVEAAKKPLDMAFAEVWDDGRYYNDEASGTLTNKLDGDVVPSSTTPSTKVVPKGTGMAAAAKEFIRGHLGKSTPELMKLLQASEINVPEHRLKVYVTVALKKIAEEG